LADIKSSCPFGLFFARSSDVAVDMETCVLPSENLLDKSDADELLPQQHRKHLPGEKLCQKIIIKAGSAMPISYCKIKPAFVFE